jgi:outer membrane biosynthesis protein TonB
VSNPYKSDRLDPPLAPLIAVSLFAHVALIGLFMFLPSRSTAEEQPVFEVQEVNLVYADEIGGGTWGTPKQGPAHDGKIDMPPPSQPVQIPSAATVKINGTVVRRKPDNQPRGPDIPDPLRKAIENLNREREGEYTRPSGDPNSANPGPPGPPGGDICSVYRTRASRLIRRSGSVPEAAGKSTTVVVTIGQGGAVKSKRVTKSSGVPHADSVALSLVPGTFGAPPPECGDVSLTVKVNFHGDSAPSGFNDSRSNKPRSRPSSGDDSIQRGLEGL